MVIIPMLLGFAANAEQILARNTSYMSKVQSMSVKVDATSSRRPGKGKATLLFKKPNSIAFDLDWGSERFSVRANSKTVIEIERNSRMYSEHGPTGGLALPPSDLSAGLSLSFPGMLLRGGLRATLGKNAKTSYIGIEKIGGVAADHIRADISAQMAQITINAWIDSKGTLRKYDIAVSEAGSMFTNSLSFSDYKINLSTTPKDFTLKLPAGYVPYVFEEEPYVVQSGQKLNLGSLTFSNGKPFDLVKWLSGKPALLVVAGPDCQPSKEMLAALPELAGSLRTLAVVPNATSKPRSTLTLVDPKGQALANMRTPSSPIIVLVDSKGVVAQVWIGFSKTSESETAREIRAVSAQTK